MSRRPPFGDDERRDVRRLLGYLAGPDSRATWSAVPPGDVVEAAARHLSALCAWGERRAERSGYPGDKPAPSTAARDGLRWLADSDAPERASARDATSARRDALIRFLRSEGA